MNDLNYSTNNISNNMRLQKGQILEGNLTGFASVDKPWLKFYGDNAKNDEIPSLTPYQYLVMKCQIYKEKCAINYYGNKISYNELIKNIDKTARAFYQSGIRSNDVVSLCMPNLPEVVYSYFALNKIGAIANMIDPRLNVEQIQQFINDANSKKLIVVDLCCDKINSIKNDLNLNNNDFISVSCNNSLPNYLKALSKFKGNNNSNNYTSWNKFLRSNVLCNNMNVQLYDKDKLSHIVYTTGTTGTPKGAMLLNENVIAMVREQLFSIPYMTPGEKFLGIMPPFIAYGSLWGMIIPLMAGLELIMIPKFDSKKFDELLIKYEPNYVMGVPSFWEELTKSEKMKNKSLKYLKCPIAGGNSMTPSSEIKVNKFFEEHDCKAKILKGYGMTEVSSSIAFPVVDECNKLGSVGVPLSKNIIKVVNPNNLEELKYNEKGELLLNGPIIIKGYFNNPEEMKKTFIEDENGNRWVKSGDIGYIDEDGCIFITGRSKRTLVRSDGHNVFPNEIENVITLHDSVDSCCVVGMPSMDYENGDIPTAYVVLKEEFRGYEDKIENKLREFSLKYLQPRDVALEYRFIDKIPLLNDGKVDYKKVEQMAFEEVEKKKVKLLNM